MRLEHEFEVPASPAETLALLLDPERVVPCIPGATLVEVTPDGLWKTTLAVKLGPVGMNFHSNVRIVEQGGDAGAVKLAVQEQKAFAGILRHQRSRVGVCRSRELIDANARLGPMRF